MWPFKKKEPMIIRSEDYYEALTKRIDIIEEKLQKLQLLAQVKETGLKKLQLPMKVKKVGRKPRVTLTQDQRNEIMQLKEHGYKQSELARKFNVHPTTIMKVIHGKA